MIVVAAILASLFAICTAGMHEAPRRRKRSSPRLKAKHMDVTASINEYAAKHYKPRRRKKTVKA